MPSPRVILADDHALIVGAFEKLLAGECDIVGQVGDGRALVAAVEASMPGLVVLDISMPLLNGLEAARQIKRRWPQVKLVFLTMNEDPGLANEAFRAGANGYLLKRSAASELATAIREVMKGRSYVTPLITADRVDSLRHEKDRRPAGELTGRQREVLQLLVEGQSMKGIAAILDVTPRTVAFHKYEMMKQLSVTTTAELIRYAIAHHIV